MLQTSEDQGIDSDRAGTSIKVRTPALQVPGDAELARAATGHHKGFWGRDFEDVHEVGLQRRWDTG